jgi:hypothetical protein
MKGAIRLELHIENTTGNLESTVKASRAFAEQMSWIKRSLRNLEEILKAFDAIPIQQRSDVPYGAGPKKFYLVKNLETELWTQNIFRQMTLLQHRFKELVEQQQETESLVRSICSFKEMTRQTRRLTVKHLRTTRRK